MMGACGITPYLRAVRTRARSRTTFNRAPDSYWQCATASNLSSISLPGFRWQYQHMRPHAPWSPCPLLEFSRATPEYASRHALHTSHIHGRPIASPGFNTRFLTDDSLRSNLVLLPSRMNTILLMLALERIPPNFASATPRVIPSCHGISPAKFVNPTIGMLCRDSLGRNLTPIDGVSSSAGVSLPKMANRNSLIVNPATGNDPNSPSLSRPFRTVPLTECSILDSDNGISIWTMHSTSPPSTIASSLINSSKISAQDGVEIHRTRTRIRKIAQTAGIASILHLKSSDFKIGDS